MVWRLFDAISYYIQCSIQSWFDPSAVLAPSVYTRTVNCLSPFKSVVHFRISSSSLIGRLFGCTAKRSMRWIWWTRRRPSSTASTTSLTAWRCTMASCTGPIHSPVASLHSSSMLSLVHTKSLSLASVAQPGSDLGEGPTIEHFTKAEEN